MTETGPVRLAVVILAAVVLIGGCAGTPPEAGGEAACPSLLDYHGHRYVGHGELKRDPATTGRADAGTVPGCDDGNGAEAAREVLVAELADVPPERAVLVEGTIYVREDLPFPAVARSWFAAPRCTTSGKFTIRGDWIGVSTPREPRYDGDLRPPFRVEIHVTHGHESYVGTTLRVRATTRTEPTLEPHDVKTSLWNGGGLVAEVRCVDRAFDAISLVSSPG